MKSIRTALRIRKFKQIGSGDAPASSDGHAGEEPDQRALLSVVQFMEDPCLIIEDRIRIKDANEPAAALLGRHREALSVLPLSECFDATLIDQNGLLNLNYDESGKWEGKGCIRRDDRAIEMRLKALQLVGGTQVLLQFKPEKTQEPSHAGSTEWEHMLNMITAPVVISHEGVYVYANKAALSILNKNSVGELLGQPVLPVLKRALDGDGKGTVQKAPERLFYIEKNKNEQIAVQINTYPILFKGDACVLQVLQDQTALQQIKVAYQRSELKYKSLFEQRTIGIIQLDTDLVILDSNKAINTLLGYTKPELKKSAFSVLAHPEDLRIVRQFAEQLGKGNTDQFSMECRCFRKDGEMLWTNIFLTRVHNESGVAESLVVFIEDITAQRKTERQLVAAQNRAEEMTLLKSSFLTNMSHEIRTPLTGIIGFATILKDEVEDEHRELTNLIERSGNRLLQTLNAILDLSMLESGSLPLNTSPLDLSEEVLLAVQLMNQQADEKGIYLKYDPPAEEVIVDLDSNSLDRIVKNLLNNAIKFTRKGGVTLRVFPDGNKAVIEVQDTGVGIGEKFVPHLFDAFRQESTGFDRSYEGTGLGLAITKRLVETLGGEISVVSRLGIGSTFKITFPRLKTGDSLSARTYGSIGSEVASEDQQKRKVLILEDNPDAQLLLEKYIGDQYDFDIVGEEHMALEKARVKQFDVVLMDINLGGDRTGIDALRALRHLSGYEATPVVAVTAYGVAGDKERFIAQGFDNYLSKPLMKEDLHRVIREMIRG